MIVESQIVRFDSLQLDSGVAITPVDVAYETYGELNAAEINAILVDPRIFRATRTPRESATKRKARLVGQHDRPRQGVRHRQVFRHLLERARRLQGTTGPASINPETGRPYAMTFPVITDLATWFGCRRCS